MAQRQPTDSSRVEESDNRPKKDHPTVDGSEKSLLNRRSYLKLGAAAVGTVAASSLAPRVGAAIERYGMQFDRVLDAVDDLGMDPTGDDPIDDALDEAYGDGTLIEFPPGEYRIEWTHFFKEGVERFGMVGAGSSPTDVRFTFPHGDTKGSRHQEYNQDNFGWKDDELHMLAVYSGRDHLLANFAIEQDEVTGTGITLTISDGIHIEDVHFLGFNPIIDYAQGTNIRPNITDPDGTGVIRNVVCTGGGVEDVYPARKVLSLSGTNHRGELLFDNLHVENLGSHPVYASNTNGCIRIENSFLKNNDNTNLRVSGRHPDKQSWVKNCNIVIDIDNAENLPDGEYYQGARGIRCDYGDDVLIEDTDIEILSGPPAAYGIGFQHNHGDPNGRASVVRNTRIRCDVDKYIPIEGQPNDGELVLDGVSVTGDADYRYNAGVVIRGRPTSVVNSCVQLDNAGEDGIYVENVDDCSISDTNINVDGKATVFNDASVSTSNLTYSDSCPVPSIDGSSGGSDGSTDSSSSDLDRTLTIISAEDSLVEYLATIDGEAAAITTGDNPGGDYDTVTTDGGTTTIDGVTSYGRGDSWAFSGTITGFELTGDATVYVDDEQIAPEDVVLETEETLQIVSAEDALVEYSFTVQGPVEPVTDGDHPGGDYDDVTTDGDLTTVDGVTSDGRGDTWVFGGEMRAFAMSGEGTVTLNGTVVAPASLPLGRTMEFDATASGDTVSYAATVDGGIAPDSSAGGVDDSDNVSGSGVEGALSGDLDAYRFSGDVTAMSVDGDATVRVDGEAVDPANFSSLLDHDLLIVADAETITNYTFTVDGSVEPVTDGEYAGGDWDEVNRDGDLVTVDGVTSDTGGDRWSFGGRLVEFQLEADGAVYVDGTQVDPSKLGTDESASFPHFIRFDGTATPAECEYAFSVSGAVAKSPDLGSLEATDVLEGATVTGTVDDDVDGYRFSGDLTSLDLSGSAIVEFD